MTQTRWITLDIIKALFVVLMIFGHTLIWWFFDLDTFLLKPSSIVHQLVIPYIQINTYLMFMFPMIAGCALRMQLEKKDHFAVIKRGLFVFLLGFAINYKSWDVLQLVGSGIVLISIVEKATKRYSPYLLLLLIILLFGTAQHFRLNLSAFDHKYWKSILFGNNSGKFYFSVFPFLGLVIFGYLFQTFQTRAAKFKQLRKFWTACLILGVCSVVVSYLSDTLIIQVNLLNVWGPEVFSPPLTRVIANTGLFLILVPIMDFAVQAAGTVKLAKAGWVYIFSKNILYIYTVHYLFAEKFIDRLKLTDHLYNLVIGFFIQIWVAYVLGRCVERLRQVNYSWIKQKVGSFQRR